MVVIKPEGKWERSNLKARIYFAEKCVCVCLPESVLPERDLHSSFQHKQEQEVTALLSRKLAASFCSLGIPQGPH